MMLITRAREFASLKGGNTPTCYESCLTVLAKFFGCTKDSLEFDKAAREMNGQRALTFVVWLRAQKANDGKKLADNTVHQRIAILRRLFRHLHAIGEIERNPFYDINDAIPKRRRVQKRPTKMIPFDLVPKLLDLPANNTKKGIRDRALLALLFGGGLRRGEVEKLNVGDVSTTVDGVPYLILREPKSGWNQTQSLPEWAWERFSSLISQRKTEGADETSALFTFYYTDGRPRGRLSDETIRRIYLEYCDELGVPGASPHSARATAASLLKAKGFEDRAVSDFLRHTTDSMVRAYDKRMRSPNDNPGILIDFGLNKN